MNWLNLLTDALKVGVAIKSMADIDEWIDEKIQELRYQSTENSALVEIAYEVAKMDADGWNYLQTHLNVKALRNEQAEFFQKFCNYVVNLENSNIKELLSYDIREAWDVFSFNLQTMESYEIAAHVGILSAYSEQNLKARGLVQAFQRQLNSGR